MTKSNSASALAPLRAIPATSLLSSFTSEPNRGRRAAVTLCTLALCVAPMTSVLAQDSSGTAAETPATTNTAAPQTQAVEVEAVDGTLPEIEIIQQNPELKKKKYPTAKRVSKSSANSDAPVKAAKAKASGQSKAAKNKATAQSEADAPESEQAVSDSSPVTVAPPLNTTRAGTAAGDIVGSRDGVLDAAGSAHVVDGEDLYTSHVFTTNEALRKVPGVVVRDEEGLGIRPNIGIRGMNPTRSTKTLLLEDGLFLSYAPYGDNASYFHPSMDRFDHVEVMKGAEQLLYGPQTISGTVNYVTPDPPDQPSGFAALTGGTNDYLNGQVFYGGWFGNAGGLVDYVHKRGEGVRDNTEHEINDLGVKAIYQLAPGSSLIAKVSYFTEASKVTYSGMTDAEFRNFGSHYNPFDNDTFDTERIGSSVRHRLEVSPDVGMTTSLYWSKFDRDWWRQSSTTTDTQCGNAFRANRLAGVAVDPDACPSIQGRLREYYAYGVDQRFDVRMELSEAVRNELKFGWRTHYENQDRVQINGLGPEDRPDYDDARLRNILSEDNTRKTDAQSFFVQSKLEMGAFSITPALRYETIDLERTNKRIDAVCDDGNPPPCQASASVSEVIPGITVAFQPNRTTSLFASIHEGFAPPRVEDAVTNTGGSVDIDAEHSINFEAGFKSEFVPGVKLDGTYFRNDFENLVAVGSIAGGNQPAAQGEALFEGFELASRIDSQKIFKTDWTVYAQTAWTWLWTAEQVGGFRCVDQLIATCIANGGFIQGNTSGNRLPYAPEHLLSARIGYATKTFDANIEVVYVDNQFADFLNLASGADHPSGAASTDALSGQFGEIDSYTIVNLGMTYTFEQSNTDVFFTVKNLFDEDYIADRTRGILPGAPRLIHLGLKQKF